MKKLLLGIILGLFLFPAINDIFMTLHDNYPENKLFNEITSKMIYPNYGINHILTKRCTKDVGENGHGWIFILRDYYKCSKVHILISDLLYGEYTRPRNIEKEKKACKKCSM